jgi:hypothetical protein
VTTIIALLGSLVLCGFAGADCIDYGDYLHWVGSVDTPDDARGVAVSGAHAYIADESSGLQVVDITNPDDPQIVGSVDTPGSAKGVFVLGAYAYIADTSAGLQVVDITNPEDPQIVGSVDTPGYAADVAVSGVYAYVADYGSGLYVVDITNPEDPQIVGSVDMQSAMGVVVSETQAYVAGMWSGLQVIDITNPENPQIVGIADTPDWAWGVAVSGNCAYIADGQSGLQVIDITNPESPHIVGNLDTPGDASGLVVSGTHVYVADLDLQILPAQCEPSGTPVGEPIISTLPLHVFPNPLSHQTAICFQLPTQGRVRATIQDVAGRQVRLLSDRIFGIGAHELPWDGRDNRGRRVAAGVYLVRVSSAAGNATLQLLVLQ